MMWDVIFLDLDGVLADFVQAALDILGCQIPDEWPKGEYRMHEVVGMTRKDFEEPITEAGWQFWAGMPAFPWVRSLIDLSRAMSRAVFFATRPFTNRAKSIAGKIMWLSSHLESPESLIFLHRKWHLAGPGKLLIDDSDAEVDAFRNAGGQAILFPQPWNSAEETLNGRAVSPFILTLREMFRLEAENGSRET